jgi:hypothetical protein
VPPRLEVGLIAQDPIRAPHDDVGDALPHDSSAARAAVRLQRLRSGDRLHVPLAAGALLDPRAPTDPERRWLVVTLDAVAAGHSRISTS